MRKMNTPLYMILDIQEQLTPPLICIWILILPLQAQ